MNDFIYAIRLLSLKGLRCSGIETTVFCSEWKIHVIISNTQQIKSDDIMREKHLFKQYHDVIPYSFSLCSTVLHTHIYTTSYYMRIAFYVIFPL